MPKVEAAEAKSFDEVLSTCYNEIKEDINHFYNDSKELASKSSGEAKAKVISSFEAIGRKIDDLDIKMKDSWYSMSDSVKETSRNTIDKLKKKKDEMKDWCKKTNEEWFK